MFSGIKSIIFGYAESDSLTSGNNNDESALSNDNSTTSTAVEKTCTISNETTALIEQTLNAATTKFTEQLLPQSPSIEQLQSSSHQLLPTLNEQHEEDEIKKKKELEAEKLKNESGKKLDEIDDDDDCFNADSWELLDFVEKPEQGRLNSTVQDDSISNNKSSGILKRESSKIISANQDDLAAAAAAQRQKLKVSFETPNLVNDKQMIDRTSPKENIDNSGSSSSQQEKEKKKKRKQKKGGKKQQQQEEGKGAEFTELAKGELAPIEAQLSNPSSVQNQANLEKIKNTIPEFDHRMNYAAALSSKPKKEENEENEDSKDDGSKSQQPRVVPSPAQGGSGAVKRNRPVSTSSWSSGDEIEAIDSMWNDIHCDDGGSQVDGYKRTDAKEVSSARNDDDNESVVSSGFSDCDYGYGGLNDFVMRPKKVQSRTRRRTTSTSSSLLGSMGQRGNEREQGTRVASSSKRSSEGLSRQQSEQKRGQDSRAKVSSKNIKPKKKKLVLTPTSSSADFLKKHSIAGNFGPIASTSSFSPIKSHVSRPAATVVLVEKPEAAAAARSESPMKELATVSATNLMPPPPPLPIASSSTSSGNDSSDLAEMDESWYVTPPPCFTGANANTNKPKPKPKEAARENALIEHPSIYIASTSKQQQQTTESSKKSTGEALAKQKAIVLKKVSSKQAASSESSDKKRKSSTGMGAQLKGEKSAKAWENKFIVTNWNDDEQDDINDFDNLFEDTSESPSFSPSSQSSLKTKRSKAAKKQPQQQRQERKVLRSETPPGLLDLPTGYESDFSNPSPALVGITDESSELSLEAAQIELDASEDHDARDENSEPLEEVDAEAEADSSRRRKRSTSERKAPTLVRPIEPERQPGWQLRRKRSKRRPLGGSSAVNTCSNGCGGALAGGAKMMAHQATSKMAHQASGKMMGSGGESASGSSASEGSNNTSARSSPTLIDRIGSSIVANLTNLTSGFPSGALPIQARAIEEVEKLSQTAVRKVSGGESAFVARRRMSKAYMDRQNDCARLANSNRRADRRLKMHTTPNGYSIDRKVQTSFH